jgi:hypothetical protein
VSKTGAGAKEQVHRYGLTLSVPGPNVGPPEVLQSRKANPAKAGAAKLRILASSATPGLLDVPKDPQDRRAADRVLGGLLVVL